MKHEIENIFMNIYIEYNGKQYNVEYAWEQTDIGVYWSAIEEIIEYESGEKLDEDSDEYKEIEEYIYDLDIEIRQGDAKK